VRGSHIVESGRRAGDVVDRIRALMKKAPPRNEPVDINKAILEVVELTRSEAVNNDILMRTDLADGSSPVEGDRVQLYQVILNLIMNAIEAMIGTHDCARELLIRTRRLDSGGVFVAVRDSGSGLAPATLDHLFDPFYTTKPGGLGLDYPSAAQLLMRMADAYRQTPTSPVAPHLNSPYLPTPTLPRDWAFGWLRLLVR
jgi:C4-dicarboxylate-specific signal transduction histidine kinase